MAVVLRHAGSIILYHASTQLIQARLPIRTWSERALHGGAGMVVSHARRQQLNGAALLRRWVVSGPTRSASFPAHFPLGQVTDGARRSGSGGGEGPARGGNRFPRAGGLFFQPRSDLRNVSTPADLLVGRGIANWKLHSGVSRQNSDLDRRRLSGLRPSSGARRF
jgi:hypothetical protein